MHTVMLIDDDVPMLEYVAHLLEGLDLDLELAASASSSEQALELFKRTRPDLVITDIGMPGMDGLELAGAFRELKQDVRLIFLTCYEDFHYSKRALQLEADDYLIKDELSAEQLAASVRKALRRLESRMEVLERYAIRQDMERNKDLLKQSLLRELLRGTGSLEETVRFGERLGIVWKHPDFLLGFLHLDAASVTERYSYGDMELLRYAVYNIAVELSAEADGITPFLSLNAGVYLIWNGTSCSRKERREGGEGDPGAAGLLADFLAAVREKSKRFLQVEVIGGYTSSPVPLRLLGSVNRQAEKRRELFFYETASPILSLSASPTFKQAGDGRFEKERKMVMLAFAENNASWFDLAVSGILGYAERESVMPQAVKEALGDIVRQAAYETGGCVEDAFARCLKDSLRKEEAARLAGWELRSLLRQHMSGKAVPEEKDIRLQAIDRYLEEHGDRMVTSLEMAAHMHLNPSYFSRYFKRLSGISFTEYVNRHKIRLAIRMLGQEKETVENVAYILGFSDRAYFSKVFKKYSGKNPSEFKGRDESCKK